MELHIYSTVDEAITSLADYFAQHMHQVITDKGSCNVALSGGQSPRNLYNLLSSADYKDQLDWTKVNLFLVDERHVPINHQESNGGMILKFLAEPLGIPAEHIFLFNTDLSPEPAAQDYERRVKEYFGDKPWRFDFVLLGLGDNAHTASLFPGTPVLQENKSGYSAVYLEDLAGWRLTMTAPLINSAQAIAFLVYGQTKADAVHHVLNGPEDVNLYPAQLIRPESAPVHWFLDESASNYLQND